MEFFQNTSIDFMKYRKYFVVLSVLMVLASIFAVFVHGALNLGIDFAGGTQVTLKFQAQPQIDELRTVVSAIGDAQIQRFGEEDANEVIIKTATVEGSEEGSQTAVIEALDRRFNGESAGGFDLNRRGSDAMAALLFETDPDRVAGQDQEVARQHYAEIAEAILSQRREDGLLSSWEEVAAVDGVSSEVREALERQTYLGDFAVLGSENVGPQIGAELRQKGILAVVSSLIGMLIYIWFRFELRFGIGALVAVTHDVLIVLGLFALAGFEFNLTTIAGFLTLIGYSVNDSVVVFDRVRENLRASGADHEQEPQSDALANRADIEYDPSRGGKSAVPRRRCLEGVRLHHHSRRHRRDLFLYICGQPLRPALGAVVRQGPRSAGKRPGYGLNLASETAVWGLSAESGPRSASSARSITHQKPDRERSASSAA